MSNEYKTVVIEHDFALSTDDVKGEFNLKSGEMDESFGVVPLSHPEDTIQVYAVKVSENAATRMAAQPSYLTVKP